MDGVRPKNLGCYGYKRDTSPNIDLLAKNGISFEKCFSSNNVTHRSFLSILSGRHVFGRGDLASYHNKEEIKSFFDSGGTFLQEILKKNSYKTYCLKKLYGWQKKGFDYYFKEDPQEKSKKWNFIRTVKKNPLIYKTTKYLLHNLAPESILKRIRFNNSGELTTDEAISIIKNNKKDNFFLFIDYFDTHIPYTYSPSFEKFQTKDKKRNFFEILSAKKGYSKKDIEFLKGCFKSGTTVEEIMDKYDNAIAYDDHLIGKVIKTLKEEGLFEKTIIFLFSDHGESLDEHEIYFSHAGLYDVSLNVPLIIAGGKNQNQRKFKSLIQLEDLTPTVLDLLKISYDPLLFDGKSLLPLLSNEKKEIRETAFMEERGSLKRRAIRTKKYKYMESPEKEFSVCTCCGGTHGGIIGLYDLEKDSEENINLAKINKKLLIEMKSKLDRLVMGGKTMNEKRRINKMLKKI